MQESQTSWGNMMLRWCRSSWHLLPLHLVGLTVLKCLWNNYPDLQEFFEDKTSKVLRQADSTQEQQQLFLLMRSSKAQEKNVISLPYKSFPRCLLLRCICSDRKRWLWCMWKMHRSLNSILHVNTKSFVLGWKFEYPWHFPGLWLLCNLMEA